MRAVVITAFAALCVGCAGRDPQPIATVQPTDANATCAMIVVLNPILAAWSFSPRKEARSTPNTLAGKIPSSCAGD